MMTRTVSPFSFTESFRRAARRESAAMVSKTKPVLAVAGQPIKT
jgi:hypothetical protein